MRVLDSESSFTHFDTLEIQRHRADKYRDLKNSVEGDTAGGVESKVADSRHRDESPQRKSNSLGDSTEEDARSHAGECTSDSLLRAEVRRRKKAVLLAIVDIEVVRKRVPAQVLDTISMRC